MSGRVATIHIVCCESARHTRHSRAKRKVFTTPSYYNYFNKQANKYYMLNINSIKAFTRKWHNSVPPEVWLKRNIFSEWPDYEAWLFRHGYISGSDWLYQRKTSRKLASKPLFSLITPVYNVPQIFFHACVESVLFQSYPYWELILVDDASTKTETLTWMKQYRKVDRRIKVYANIKNNGICETTNKAIKLAQGEFTVFLDHDDKLAPNALFELAKIINKTPNADIIYSDRDLISERDNLYMHLFKPDWAPETILASNYLCHLTCYKHSLLIKLNGLDKATEGSQDHDLILRAEETNPMVIHIPKVLYHWRQHQGSVALNPQSKEYAYKAARLSIQKAMERRGLSGTVNEIPTLWRGNYRVKLRPPQIKDIHICTFKHHDKWHELLAQALKESNGKPYLIFLGEGISPSSADAMEELVSWFQIKDVFMTTGKVVDKNGNIVHAGLTYDSNGKVDAIYQGLDEQETPGYMAWASTVHNVSLPYPNCFALRCKALHSVLEELEHSHRPHLIFSIAMALRKKQKRIVYTPFARFFQENAINKTLLQTKEVRKDFYRKHQTELSKGDPYFNRNLTVTKEGIALNFAPDRNNTT